MLQVGSWVPAEAVTMTVLDGIFTRMGASDNILQVRTGTVGVGGWLLV
jgi:DNA mismatch repair protein MSH3